MKKLTITIVTFLFAFTQLFTVFAENFTVTTRIPAEHFVQLEVVNGGVVADGVYKTQKEAFKVSRHKEQSYLLVPNSNQELSQVVYNNIDVTDKVKNNFFTASVLTEDATLSVLYKNAPEIIADGRVYKMNFVTNLGEENEEIELLMDMGSDSQKIATKAGEIFSVLAIATGRHSITVLRDGKIIGQQTLILDKAQETLSMNSSDGIIVITPGKNTTEIQIKLTVQDDYSLLMENVEDVSPRLPTTGEDNTLALSILVSVMSAGMILVLLLLRKKFKPIKSDINV